MLSFFFQYPSPKLKVLFKNFSKGTKVLYKLK